MHLHCSGIEVALMGTLAVIDWQDKFHDLQVGYDTGANDVIDDVVINDGSDGHASITTQIRRKDRL